MIKILNYNELSYDEIFARFEPTASVEDVVADIIKTAKSAGGKYLRDVKMFDVYTGDKLGEGLKSVAISLSFRADDKTLSDDDIKKDIDSIISKLESKLGAKLRQ